jgi:hypothetical protein
MKRIVLTFGLISGAILAVMMVATIPFMDRIGFEKGEIIGYTTMVLSFLMVFFGIRTYRDSIGGKITFGRAFKVGILITLISCVCYVVTWEILYFNFMHDFMDKYGGYMLEKSKAAGASAEALKAQIEQLERARELYQNPFFNVAITFLEPFPVGLVITLVSAAILRKRA